MGGVAVVFNRRCGDVSEGQAPLQTERNLRR